MCENVYVNNDISHKFHCMWFVLLEVEQMIEDLNVKNKRGKLGSRRHNVFNVRLKKYYINTGTHFYQAPKCTLEEVAKQTRHIIRIIDMIGNKYN